MPIPPDEAARLLDLEGYRVLDTGPEAAFERIVRLAARLLRVPAAAINFIDHDRHHNKANIGLPGDLPREASFCAWAILQDTPLVVPDLREDARFAGSPFVHAEDGPRFRTYAGMPLGTPAGHRIGTLCVLDTHERDLGLEDLEALQDLASLAMSELEHRRLVRTLQTQLDTPAELDRGLAHARTLDAVIALMDSPLSAQDVALRAAALVAEAVHADWAGVVRFEGARMTARTVVSRPPLSSLPPVLSGGGESLTRTLRDLAAPLYVDEYALHPDAVPALVEGGVRAAAWVPLGEARGATYLLVTVRAGEARARPWREGDRVLLEAAARTVRGALHRRAALEAATHAARQDALTGALNRRAFEEDVLANTDGGGSVALVDLDGFKALNDSEGHAQGDKVLRLFATALAAEVGTRGRVYRLGGDEFVVHFADPVTEEEVDDLVDVAVLASRQVTAARLGASVGLAHRHEGEATDTVALADERMYAVKRRRRALRDSNG